MSALSEGELFRAYRSVRSRTRERAGVISLERLAWLAEELEAELGRIDLEASGLSPDALGDVSALVRDLEAERLRRITG